jgi:hypothetical protein
MNNTLRLEVSFDGQCPPLALPNPQSDSIMRDDHFSLSPIHTPAGHFPADPHSITGQPHLPLAQNTLRTNTLPLREPSNQHQGRQPKIYLRLCNPSKISKRSPPAVRGVATSSGCDRRTPIHYRCERVTTPRMAYNHPLWF